MFPSLPPSPRVLFTGFKKRMKLLTRADTLSCHHLGKSSDVQNYKKKCGGLVNRQSDKAGCRVVKHGAKNRKKQVNKFQSWFSKSRKQMSFCCCRRWRRLVEGVVSHKLNSQWSIRAVTTVSLMWQKKD